MGLTDDPQPFWNVVLRSPILRTRTRESLDHPESLIAGLLAEAGDPDAGLNAALFVAAARIGFLHIARRILAGERPGDIAAECRAFVAWALRRVVDPRPG